MYCDRDQRKISFGAQLQQLQKLQQLCYFSIKYASTTLKHSSCAAYIGIGGMKIEDEPRH
jgi:hypothetical protein